MDRKHLDTIKYKKNSRQKKHSGKGVRHTQKSRSWRADHNRVWRKIKCKHRIKKKREHARKLLKYDINRLVYKANVIEVNTI